jgi:hypothetical protein
VDGTEEFTSMDDGEFRKRKEVFPSLRRSRSIEIGGGSLLYPLNGLGVLKLVALKVIFGCDSCIYLVLLSQIPDRLVEDAHHGWLKSKGNKPMTGHEITFKSRFS